MKNNNLMIGLIGGIVIVAIAIGALLSFRQEPASTTKPKDTNSTNNQTEANQTTTITYTDNGFSPDTYTAKVGDTVKVTNNSSRDLQFSSDNHPTHTKEPELNMDVLRPGELGNFTVTKTGTWGFHNHLDAEDTGSLTVKQ